jgi:hypothetical protein
MKTETQVDHERVFRKLLELRPSLTPSSILIDFEIATMHALFIVLANATMFGYLFHLGQSLWRRIRNEGLVNLYRDDVNEEVKLHSNMLISLSFVPPEDAGAAFNALNDSRPDNLETVYTLFEDNYTLVTYDAIDVPSCQLVFYHHVEHMQGRVTDGLPRTNNSIEGWHNALQSSVACHRPTIYTLVDHFCNEQDLTEQTMSCIHSGFCNQPASNTKYVQLCRRIAAIVSTYEGRDLTDYLRAVNHGIEIKNVPA